MNTTSWMVFFYGLLVIALGVWGYVEGGSSASLWAGGGFGLLLMATALILFCKIRAGAYAAIFLSLALTATFAIRYSTTGKTMPAAMGMLSGAMFLFLLLRTVRWKQ